MDGTTSKNDEQIERALELHSAVGKVLRVLKMFPREKRSSIINAVSLLVDEPASEDVGGREQRPFPGLTPGMAEPIPAADDVSSGHD